LSHTNRFATTMTDAEKLSEALRQLGFKNVIQHATPQPLQVFHGAEQASAEIIIPKSEVAKLTYGFGDLGFARKADGTFEIVGDGMDIDRLSVVFGHRAFGELVGQRYAEEVKKDWALGMGFIFQGREEIEVDGHTQINLLYAVRD
jgi:Protein of unknown function (DUF1257)